MPCNASYARFIFGKFFTSTIILYVLLFAQKVLFFLQKVGVTFSAHNESRNKSGVTATARTKFLDKISNLEQENSNLARERHQQWLGRRYPTRSCEMAHERRV
jgi:hypothetical protein